MLLNIDKHLSIILVILGVNTQVFSQEKPNVLFLIADDMNDWVGCLGNEQVKTPNIDKLATSGVLFTEAHSAAPVCNPSRTSVLLGRYPSTSGVYNNGQWWLPGVKGAVSLPKYFRKNGYFVAGAGKIFHHTAGFNDPTAWDEYFLWNPKAKTQGLTEHYHYPSAPGPENYPASQVRNHTMRNFDFAPLDISDEEMPDGKVANYAADFLKRSHDEPFFLAVGMFRPHVEWYVPKAYFDMYPLEDIVIPPYLENDLDDVPEEGKKIALKQGSNHQFIKKSGNWKKAIQAYQASITFSDAQIGKVLDALESGPNSENTIVIFWSDHGYHLGEKDHWHKQTLWYRSTHVPFVIKIPGNNQNGQVCDRPVSLVNIYKTLIELCALPESEDLDGVSLTPLLKNVKENWNYPAIVDRDYRERAIYKENYHYIVYSDGSDELYDRKEDKNEWNNLSVKNGNEKILAKLRSILNKDLKVPVPSKPFYGFNETEYSFTNKANGQLIYRYQGDSGYPWLVFDKLNEE